MEGTMKTRMTWMGMLLLLSACAPPIHDDPDATDQVANANALWAGSKDGHFEGKHNDFIDDLMLNGNTATGGSLDGLVYSQAPGCAVGVLKNGQITYLQSYGYANESTDWTLDTMAPVASISKTFTAIGAMRMVEEGLVELDEPIQTYLGSTGEFAGLTLDDLLSLDAGIPEGAPDWTVEPSCPASMPASASTDWCLSHPRVAFDAVKDDITLGPQAGKYANISFMAAGAVIDQVSYDSPDIQSDHQGYEPWLWHQLGHWADDYNVDGELTTLALVHSWRDGDISPYARGYDCNGSCGNVPPKAFAWDTAGSHEGWWGPAGGWAMTIGDLARFVALIDNESVLSNASWNTMFTKRTNVFDAVTGLDYGLGTIVENWGIVSQNEDIVWHGGDLLGHSSVWFYSKFGGTSYGVAIQCNSNGGEAKGFGLRAYAGAIVDYARAGGDIYPEIDVVIGFATSGQVQGEYVVDSGMTNLISPSSLHLPWAMDEDLILGVYEVDQDVIQLTLEQRDVSAPPRGNGDGNIQKLGSDNYTPMRFFRTQPTDINLNSKTGQLKLIDASLDIGFAKNASHLAENRISALIDLADLQRNGAIKSWSRLCRIAEQEDDVSCVPCTSSKATCLPVEYEFQATRLRDTRGD